MPKIMVEVPKNCRECNCRDTFECNLFDRALDMYDNGGDDWGYIRCDECKQAEVKMTNREKILSQCGDTLIANQLIECVRAYRSKEELRSHNPHIEYKFNKQIYRDFDAAYKTVKEWLDEKYEEEKEPTRTVRVKVDFSEGYEKYKNSENQN